MWIFKNVVHKVAEMTGKFVGNKIADKTVKPKHIIDENPRNIEEIIVSPGRREEILKELRQVL